EALEREAGGDAHGGLLHDPDVDRAPGVVTQRGLEQVEADVRQHERQPLVVVEQLDERVGRSLPHCGAHRFASTTATTAVGASERRESASRSRSWSRPSTVTASQPNTASLSATSPSSIELERLSIATSVRLSSPTAPAWRIASQFEPSFSSASPVRTTTRWSSRPFARSAYATPTAIGRPCPSEPVE